MIKSQKTIIAGLQKNNDSVSNEDDLIEARKTITLKETEISKYLKELERVKTEKSNEESDDQMIVLNAKLQSLEEDNETFKKRLEDQITIRQKTELAFETQGKLIESKTEIINNLKTIAAQNTGIEPPIMNIPGLQETVTCLSNLALHGVILNGLLLWVDIQRRTIASGIWKAEATKHFTQEEITNAKNLLWDACDENIIGKLINRQGGNKSQTEIDDIETALSKLAEKQVMPLYVATSTMVIQNPKANEIITCPNFEEIKKQIDKLDKKYDRTVSKTDQGSKKVEEVLKRLDVIDRNMKGKEPRTPQIPASNRQHQQGMENFQHFDIPQSGPSTFNVPTNVRVPPAAVPAQNTWADVVQNRPKNSEESQYPHTMNQNIIDRPVQPIPPVARNSNHIRDNQRWRSNFQQDNRI